MIPAQATAKGISFFCISIRSTPYTIHTDLVRFFVCHVHFGPLRLAFLYSNPYTFWGFVPHAERRLAPRYRDTEGQGRGWGGSSAKQVVVEALSAVSLDTSREKGPLAKRFGLFRGIPLAMTDTQIKSISNYQMKMHTEGLLRVDVSHDFENL